MERTYCIHLQKSMRKIIFLTRTMQSWCRSKKYVKGLFGNHKTNTRICCTSVAGYTSLAGYTGIFVTKVESVQKRALKIIKPGEESYEELLSLFNVEKLQSRPEKLCRQYMGKIKSPNHQLSTLITQQDDREHEYNLRNDNNRNFYLFNNRPYCRTKLCGDFFTFKYY